MGTTSATAGYPASSSAHDYDLGCFQIATVGQQASSVVGRLYVHYSVELIRAKTETTLSGSTLAAKVVGAGGGIAKNTPFGNTATVTGTLPVTASSNALTFGQACQVIVEVEIVGTVISFAATPTIAGTASVTAILGASGNIMAGGAGGTINGMIGYLVTAAAGQTMSFDFSPVCTTLTASTVRISLYPASLTVERGREDLRRLLHEPEILEDLLRLLRIKQKDDDGYQVSDDEWDESSVGRSARGRLRR